jgi:hypothetical protein
MNMFDEKYFEDGIRNHISAYENYSWMPERTIREASSITRAMDFDNVLDYGCAKGFMVYAMRLLGKEAYGVDISEYAVKNCHSEVKDYLSVINSTDQIKGGWDLIIAKDVLEHIPKEQLPEVLRHFRARTKQLLVAVPLGDGRRYRIREYEMDITHVVREPEEYWLKLLADAGFKIKYFDYTLGHLKTNWTEDHPFGNAFIIGE